MRPRAISMPMIFSTGLKSWAKFMRASLALDLLPGYLTYFTISCINVQNNFYLPCGAAECSGGDKAVLSCADRLRT